MIIYYNWRCKTYTSKYKSLTLNNNFDFCKKIWYSFFCEMNQRTRTEYTAMPLCCSVYNGPKNESEWHAAAARVGCNDTRRYHSVSDKFHSPIIEFCYNKTRFLIDKNKIFHYNSRYVDINSFNKIKNAQNDSK